LATDVCDKVGTFDRQKGRLEFCPANAAAQAQKTWRRLSRQALGWAISKSET
jgi:hypothetical protein